jgi:hypothetical protein
MIETVKEKELRLNHKIICPHCKTEFESDAELIFYTDWVYESSKPKNVEFYECPVCSETRRNISDFYE